MELKALAKRFLVIIIFPCWNKRYQEVVKNFVHHKYQIDGVYHNMKKEKSHEFRALDDWTLDYNTVLQDYKIPKSQVHDRKVVIIVPLNMSLRLAKTEFLAGYLLGSDKPAHYSEKQILNFFPRVKTSLSNLKILCVPNFILEEKNERSSNLNKCSFYKLSRAINFLLDDLSHELDEAYVSLANDLNSSTSLPLTPLCSNDLAYKNTLATKEDSQHTPTKKRDYRTTENGKDRNGTDVGVYSMNFNKLFEELRRTIHRNKKWSKIKQIKQSNSLTSEANPPISEIEVALMKQRVIDELLELQKVKGWIKGNVMSHFIVGDLFSRNNFFFKAYEKDSFFNKKTKNTLEQITSSLSNYSISPNKVLDHYFGRNLDDKNETFDDVETQLDQDDVDLMFMKHQSKVMQLYLGD